MAEFSISEDWDDYTPELPDGTGIEQITVGFINDQVTDEGDRNLVVDHVRAGDGTIFETESPATFGTGTFQNGNGCAPGYKQSETHRGNGLFRYA